MNINFGSPGMSPGKGNTKADTDLKTTLDRYKESLQASQFGDEEEKQKYDAKICQKVSAGKKLTAKEMNYLRANNPTMYIKALRVQMKRETLENKLDNCKSKEDVEDVIGFELGMINEKDPDRDALINAVKDVEAEYKKTDKYKGLPEKSEEEKEAAGSHTSDGEDYMYTDLSGTYRSTYIKNALKDFDIKI